MKNTFHNNTSLIGLIGHPIKHTYSPYIHNVAIQMKNLDYIYLPFDVPTANLQNAVRGMIALGINQRQLRYWEEYVLSERILAEIMIALQPDEPLSIPCSAGQQLPPTMRSEKGPHPAT